MRLKISLKELFLITASVLVVLYTNFYAMIPEKVYVLCMMFIIFCAVLSFLKISNQRMCFRINPVFWQKQIKWMLLLLISVVGNVSLSRGYYTPTLRFAALILLCIALSYGGNSIYYIPWLLAGIGFVNVIGTFFFMIFPNKYGIMEQIYGYCPTGTQYGTYGYRAGIADHYSQNAIFIAIVFLVLAISVMIYGHSVKLRKKTVLLLCCAAALAALVLTTKRGPLLFSILAVIAVYYLINVNKIFTRTFKLICIVFVIGSAFYLAIPYVPELNRVFERFSAAGSDSETLTRFRMWDLAISLFKEHPLTGIGWYGFRYEHAAHIYNAAVNDSRYMYLHAHNVYLQILCERGILGFGLYVYILLSNLIGSCRTLIKWKKKKLTDKDVYVLAVAVGIQIYYIMYSFTGNCLYDIVFCFYALAVGVSCSIRYGYNSRTRMRR